jgi:hypothetical protein
MNEVQYKGYVIILTPFQLQESDEWTLDLIISKHRSSSVPEAKFLPSNRFKTKAEAIEHCLIFGRKVIDGEIRHSDPRCPYFGSCPHTEPTFHAALPETGTEARPHD